MCLKKNLEINMIKLKELMKILDHQIKKKKKTYIKHNLALLSVNQEHAKIKDETRHLLMAFDGESLYQSARVDK